MVSVEQARELLIHNVDNTEMVSVSLEEAVGLILAEDLVSGLNLPQFNQSAMDGYAFQYNTEGKYELIGEIKAGDSSTIPVTANQAVRIFTGAPIPPGADTVVMQEHVEILSGGIKVSSEGDKKGTHIRIKGSQIGEGQVGLKAGSLLTPAAVGFVAMLGLPNVKVYQKPTAAILTTGSELVKPGFKLEYGQIYESNSYAVQAALNQVGITQVSTGTTEDIYELTLSNIQKALAASDVLLLTGGISVGEYDFVGRAFKALGVEQVFHKVAQKPGKPLFFGKKGKKLVFGLPGNPASTLVCFYEYVVPAIRQSMGYSNFELEKRILKLETPLKKKNFRAEFFRGKVTDAGVKSLEGQESFIMKSFAEADCLIYAPKDVTEMKVGDEVEVHLLP